MKLEPLILTQAIQQKWAVTLSSEPQEKLESRVVKLLDSLLNKNQIFPNQWVINLIDATGKYGDKLTQEQNQKDIIHLSTSDLLQLFAEEGQVIELEATLMKHEEELLKIIIQDGSSIDVLGSGAIFPISVLGNYQTVDKAMFLW
jgi:hypothetical protein